jgi:hypothetical protein
MKKLDSSHASSTQTGHACYMLTEFYVEALLVNEELADLVWEAWDGGLISDELAA